MIDTQPPQGHLFPHQTHPEGTVSRDELEADFTKHRDAYDSRLHSHIEAHLSKSELEKAITEKGEVYTSRLVDLLDSDISGFVSREEVAGVLDELRDESGELAPGSMRLVVDAAKGLWGREKSVPGVLYEVMAERPDFLTTMIEQAHATELNDWDTVATTKVIEGTAEVLERSQIGDERLDYNPFRNEKPPEPSPEALTKMAERQRMASQLRSLAAEFPSPPYEYDHQEATTKELFLKYGKFADQGLSLAEAHGYNRLIPGYAKNTGELPESVDQIKDVVQKFDTADTAIKRLYMQGGNLPQRVAAIHPLLEQIAAKGGDNVATSLEAFAEMAGCGGYNEESYAPRAKSIIDSLAAQGVTGEGMLHLIGDKRNMQEIISSAAEKDAEQHELSLSLLAKIGRHDTVAFIEESEDGRQRVLHELLRDPATYAEYVQTIDTHVDGVAASGFPTELTATKVYQRFSQYYGNLGIRDDIGSITESLEQQKAIGGSAQMLEAISPLLAERLINGNLDTINPADITEAAASMTRLKEDHPDVYEFMGNHIAMSSDMENLHTRLAFASGFVENADIFAMLDERESEESSFDSYRNSFIHSMAYSRENRAAVMERFMQLRKGEAILVDGRFKDFSTIATQLFESPDSDEIITLLTSDSVQRRLDDPKALDAINGAINPMLFNVGKFNAEQALSAFEATGGEHKEWLSNLVHGEAQLKDGGLTDEQIGEYRELFVEVMPRQDKDGNYYDDASSVLLAMESTYGRESLRTKGASIEALSWYRQAGMPIAGYGVVASWRADALAAGVADEPRAVYDWIYKNPEQVAHISNGNLADYIEHRLPRTTGRSAEETLAAAQQELAERDGHFRIFMNISTEALTKVAESGGVIKSILDAGVDVADRGSGYDLQRSGVEVALGLRSMDGGTPHPIYGSCGFVDGDIPVGATGYGDILLTFKETPELAARTSYTPEDSFHGANRLTATDAKLLRLAKDTEGVGHTRTNEYVESQIQGGLNLAAVDTIYVNNDAQREAVVAALPEELAERVIVRT